MDAATKSLQQLVFIYIFYVYIKTCKGHISGKSPETDCIPTSIVTYIHFWHKFDKTFLGFSFAKTAVDFQNYFLCIYCHSKYVWCEFYKTVHGHTTYMFWEFLRGPEMDISIETLNRF